MPFERKRPRTGAVWRSGDENIDGNLDVTGTANITGNTTIGGTLGVTGAVTAAVGLTATTGHIVASAANAQIASSNGYCIGKYVSANTHFNAAAQSSVPATAISSGSFYQDDGTNTDHGDPGLRYYDGSIWLDIPYYQSGTWTPVMGDGTNDFTLSVAQGIWFRIGNLCFTQALCTWTSKGAPPASGAIVLEGISPYAFDTTNITNVTGYVTGTGLIDSAGYTIGVRKSSGSNLNFVQTQRPYTSSTSVVNATDASFHTSGTVYVSLWYPVTATPA